MNSIELINIIKKMLADRLTTSEREQLLNEKPMVNFQSQQWDKAPKAHIQDHVPPHTILNKIMVRCRNEKQPVERNKKYYRIGYSIALLPSSLSAFGLPTIFHHPTLTSALQ